MGSCPCLLSVSVSVVMVHSFLKLCNQALNMSKFSTSAGQETLHAASDDSGSLPSALADGRTQFFVVVVLKSLLFRNYQLRPFSMFCFLSLCRAAFVSKSSRKISSTWPLLTSKSVPD